jgi:predicted transposase YbfD/YdcC
MATLPLLAHFQDMDDPRRDLSKRHKLLDIIGLTVCAVIAGADDFVQVEAFGKAKLDWLRRFLDLPNGVPSHDTLGRVFALIDPERFAGCFSAWVAAFTERLGLGHVAIDGKALRGSRGDGNSNRAIHTVSAWASEARLTLGIAEVDHKSNEITAIPVLLEMLELQGALVTIDAMGCQKEVAQKIRERQADYVLAVKENQPRLFEDIETLFSRHVEADMQGPQCSVAQIEESGHGRQETRTVIVFRQVEEVRDLALWEDLASLVVVLRERKAGERSSCEVSYYISSLKATAEQLGAVIRGHWGIENGCHWVLDVAFREDHSRLRTDHGPANMACIRRMALAMLNKAKGAKGGIKTRRLTAAWNTDFMERVLQVDIPSHPSHVDA